MMNIYLSRSFPRSNSSFLLCSGNALQSEVLCLREEMFLVDAGPGTPIICMQDEPTGVPINRAAMFENKVGSLDLVTGESLIKEQILERFFIDLVAGESLIKEQAGVELENLPPRQGYYIFLFEIPGLVFIGIFFLLTHYIFLVFPRPVELFEVDGASDKLFRYSSPEPGQMLQSFIHIQSPSFFHVYIASLQLESFTSLPLTYYKRVVSPRPYSIQALIAFVFLPSLLHICILLYRDLGFMVFCLVRGEIN